MSDLGELRNYMSEVCKVDKHNRKVEEYLEKEVEKIRETMEHGFDLFRKHYYVGDLKRLEFSFTSNWVIINDQYSDQKKEMKIDDDNLPDYNSRKAVKEKIEEFEGYSVSCDDEFKECFIVTVSLSNEQAED